MKRLWAIAVLAALAGCTRLPMEIKTERVATYASDGVTTATLTTSTTLSANYLTLMQDKSLSVHRPEWGDVTYSTNNSPTQTAVEALAGLATKSAAAAK